MFKCSKVQCFRSFIFVLFVIVPIFPAVHCTKLRPNCNPIYFSLQSYKTFPIPQAIYKRKLVAKKVEKHFFTKIIPAKFGYFTKFITFVV
jgi:hypothetical protein